MLMFSGFVPNIYFGFFAVIIIFIALVSDLYLLPAAIYTIISTNGSKNKGLQHSVSTNEAFRN
jgi:predicted RND superfamily exporter protein